MINLFLIYFGKTFSFLIKNLKLGGGSTWPGHIALKINPNFSKEILRKSKVKTIVIGGTNGKTTTGKLIATALINSGYTVAHNSEGANLTNGLASAVLLNTRLDGKFKKNFLIFESDENALPRVLKTIDPNFVVFLNLFRDQMDRYGEIDTTAKKWASAISNLDKNCTLILNADDASISFLGKTAKQRVEYFGLTQGTQTKPKHGSDSIYCPNCFSLLSYNFVSFSHLGDWYCNNCGLKRPKVVKRKELKTSLIGNYNEYNILAAAKVLKDIGIKDEDIEDSFQNFKPAFGRQEKINFEDKKIELFLSKNPTSFNESLSTISSLNPKNILIILNDRIPDGVDVSWIWDIDTSLLPKIKNISVTGDRVFDMALRLRYANLSFDYERDLRIAIQKALKEMSKGETLFILPTYSAMLDVRKILKGRKLL
jgi:UDP-N-acetylmuramyl tripeptide synthase